MKCDELKDKWFNAFPEIMGIEGGEPTKCYGKADVDEAIAELKDKNERLKKKMDDYHLMSDIRRAKIKELKRALWIARAEKAHVIILIWNIYCYQNNCLYYRDFMNIECNPFRRLPKKTAMEWSDLWESIETKCRAKAEKYK